jgi:hypothetical protein
MYKIHLLFFFLPIANIVAQESLVVQFDVGEKLEYKVHYGIIDAGKAYLEIKKSNTEQYRFKAFGKSTGLFNLFFKVRDRYESIVDKESLQPIHFYRDVREGNYKKKETVFFNYDLSQAETSRDTIALPEVTQDILSSFYYFRSQQFDSLKIGDKIPLQIYLDDEFMETEIFFLGRDTIKTKFGKIACKKWAPNLETGRVFDDKQGMTIWVSDDINSVPLRVETKVLVGSISIDLIKYKNLSSPLKGAKH